MHQSKNLRVYKLFPILKGQSLKNGRLKTVNKRKTSFSVVKSVSWAADCVCWIDSPLTLSINHLINSLRLSFPPLIPLSVTSFSHFFSLLKSTSVYVYPLSVTHTHTRVHTHTHTRHIKWSVNLSNAAEALKVVKNSRGCCQKHLGETSGTLITHHHDRQTLASSKNAGVYLFNS